MKVIKFGAVWCPGCLIMRPRWQELEKEIPGLKTEYVEYKADHPLVEQYKIDDRLPVCVFINKEGEELLRLTGEISKKHLLEVINENIDR